MLPEDHEAGRKGEESVDLMRVGGKWQAREKKAAVISFIFLPFRRAPFSQHIDIFRFMFINFFLVRISARLRALLFSFSSGERTSVKNQVMMKFSRNALKNV